MKKILTLVAVLASVSVMAFQARMDVNGIKEGNNLTPGKTSEGSSLRNASWYKDEAKKKQHICFASPKLGDEWQEVEYTFTPDKDGKVNLSIRGQWHNKKAGKKPNYVYFKEVEIIKGSTLRNGDFSKKNKDGSPAGWWYNKKGKDLPVFTEEDGVTIVKVQHDNGMAQSIPVTKGQPVTVKAKVKNAAAK